MWRRKNELFAYEDMIERSKKLCIWKFIDIPAPPINPKIGILDTIQVCSNKPHFLNWNSTPTLLNYKPY